VIFYQRVRQQINQGGGRRSRGDFERACVPGDDSSNRGVVRYLSGRGHRASDISILDEAFLQTFKIGPREPRLRCSSGWVEDQNLARRSATWRGAAPASRRCSKRPANYHHGLIARRSRAGDAQIAAKDGGRWGRARGSA